MQKTDYSKEEKEIKKLEEKIVGKLKDVDNKLKNPEELNLSLKEIKVNINKKESEKFYFESFADLIKSVEKEIDQGGVVGTPVKVFGQTVIVGGGRKEKKKVEELDVVDKGELYISNHRLLFIGKKRKYEIKLKEMLSYSFDLDNNLFKVSSEKLEEVLFFRFNKPLEALKVFLIIKILNSKKEN